jgi:hypothetical protein
MTVSRGASLKIEIKRGLKIGDLRLVEFYKGTRKGKNSGVQG